MAVYTLFSQGITSPLVVDATSYTLGVQFSVSQAATLTGMWFYSASGASALPSKIKLFAVSGGSLILDQAATWSGAVGTGWVRAPFTVPPSLTVSTAYKGCVFEPSAVSWRPGIANYFSTGAGSGGVTNGPLSAPNNANAAQGQESFIAAEGYPNSSFNATNYLVDVEITVTFVPVQLRQAPDDKTHLKKLLYLLG